MKKLLILTLLPLFSMAQNKLDIATLWQFGRISEHMVSPDGKLAIYAVKHYDVKANKGKNTIYIKPISQSAPARTGLDLPLPQPTPILDETINAFGARFTPDGLKISYLRTINDEVQLFECDLSGKNSKQITQIKGGINGYKYSPKMNQLALVMDVKMDSKVSEVYPDLDKSNARIIDNLFYRHWDAWHDYAYSHLFIQAYENGQLKGEALDLLAGEKFDCPLQPSGDDDDYTWSPDGGRIAYTCKKMHGTEDATSTNSDIYVYDIQTKATTNVSEANLGYDKNPQFSPDGTKIAWLSMATPGYESDRNTLVYFDFNKPKASKAPGNGKIQAAIYIQNKINPLTHNFDYTLNNFIWLDNARLAFSADMEGTQQICMFDPKLKSLNQVVLLTQGNHDIGGFSLIPNLGKLTVLAAKMTISMPTELFVMDLIAKTETPFSQTNKALLDQTKMGKVEKRIVKTTDNKDMLVWVIYPPDFDASKKYPTLLYCQGGPQSMVSQFFSYRWNFQLMAANGYIVVAPNRRGLPGFGSEWNDAIANDYGGQCMKDYLSAIDDVAKEPFVNKEKLGAVGASFGGYSVYWLAGNHNKRFKTFIAHCGMFNMESWYGATEEMFFANHDNGGPYWDQKQSPNNFDASPHKFVKNWDTPILIIHNEKDYRVPLNQGMEAFTAAQLKGIPSRFLYFPDENHWVTKPQNGILWQRVFFEWLDQTLK
ncbi:MAG: S9 family peptidase [Bacteroidia bacterium]|nr:S9 family peptidase [Bacteroidia bacterium]MCF8427521.1 S9 family peptidase [Bacteroidia bacterium]MCF8446731.1 S9 family peptidase [Bacteroidia bacterium]